MELELNQIFAANLRILMAKWNVKISEVSRDSGIARSTLTSIYHGKTAMIQFQTISALAEYFNVKPARFFEEVLHV